jgi:carboxymethylenebutenolidase
MSGTESRVHPPVEQNSLSRRSFGVLAAAAGATLVDTIGAYAAAPKISETDVVVNTEDGRADAALFHPTGSGFWPGVVMFPDELGLRPAFRDMGRALAAAGYAVLIPNPYYRTRKAPVLAGSFDFNNPADQAKLADLRAGISPAGAELDQQNWIAYLDNLTMVPKRIKIGVVGYGRGGVEVVQMAALRPDRVGAACSFYGSDLVTDRPDSPHLLAPRIRAKSYFGIAKNDAARQPGLKDKLVAAYAAVNNPAKVDVYAADYGWCPKGSSAFNRAESERAWNQMLAMYKAALI